MIDTTLLLQELRSSLDSIRSTPLLDLLVKYEIIQTIARDCILVNLRNQVKFSGSDETKAIQALFTDTQIVPPESLDGDWIVQIPSDDRSKILERWNLLRQQKWIEMTYEENVESYFLSERSQLEQFIYSFIRLSDQGLADELYLRIIADESDFLTLAGEFSEGLNKYKMGICGPQRRSDIHPKIVEVLEQLQNGDTAAPFAIGSSVLLVHLIHRQDASLDNEIKVFLYRQMFERELSEFLSRELPTLISQLSVPSVHSESSVLGSSLSLQ